MDGLITGKHAQNYERNTARSDSRDYKRNTFISRSIPKGAVVADFCSGTGLGIEFALHKASKVYGIEASPDMLAIAQKKFKNNNKVTLLCSTVQKTTLKNASVDVVLIRMGLHHIGNKSAVLTEAYRILKPNGKLIIMDIFSMFNNRLVNYILDRTQDSKKNHSYCSLHYCNLALLTELVINKFNSISLEKQGKGLLIKANIVLQKK